nr:MAG TPA: hypothetical protein [Caudoviricetes sp.]
MFAVLKAVLVLSDAISVASAATFFAALASLISPNN